MAASNGGAEGPHRSARLEPRVHNLSHHPRRHCCASRTPPAIVRRHGYPQLRDLSQARDIKTPMVAPESATATKSHAPRSSSARAMGTPWELIQSSPDCAAWKVCAAPNVPPRQKNHETMAPTRKKRRRRSSSGVSPRRSSRSDMPSNGEVEGPHDHAGQATRAHNLLPRPRSQTDHASRTPPTIVRSRPDVEVRRCHTHSSDRL
jgi:hypothetical protein